MIEAIKDQWVIVLALIAVVAFIVWRFARRG
jgi:hypothetical protein